jgi:hypothetical protein
MKQMANFKKSAPQSLDLLSCENIHSLTPPVASTSALLLGLDSNKLVCPLPAHLCFLGLSLAAFSRRNGPNTKRRYKKHAPL